MYVLFAFDTEDVYYPPESPIDEVPGWLARIMTEEGIVGTFFVMGEKARSLKERGRSTVLQAMAQHDIASHQQGNCHPLVPELAQASDWDTVVAAMREYEDTVRNDLTDAFGCGPAALSRHNNYFAPQHVAVAGERGLPYMYMVMGLPEWQQPLWYAGAVTFPEDDDGFFAGFDMIYSRDELFAAKLAELDSYLERRAAAGCEWSTVFACHPVRVLSRGWLEHYCLASGSSRSPRDLGWRYGVKDAVEIGRAQNNFRRLCRYLKQHEAVEVVGIAEAGRLFGTQPASVGRDALVAYAEHVSAADVPVLHALYSPAELVWGLAASLVQRAEYGDLPEAVERPAVLGPVTRPVTGLEQLFVTGAELTELCRELVAAIRNTGHLPANLHTASARIGIGQFAVVAARAYRAVAGGEEYSRLRLSQGARYPGEARTLDGWVRERIGEHWAMPLDFSCEQLAEHARLQAWTLKPAWVRAPQGPVADGERAGARVRLPAEQ